MTSLNGATEVDRGKLHELEQHAFSEIKYEVQKVQLHPDSRRSPGEAIHGFTTVVGITRQVAGMFARVTARHGSQKGFEAIQTAYRTMKSKPQALLGNVAVENDIEPTANTGDGTVGSADYECSHMNGGTRTVNAEHVEGYLNALDNAFADDGVLHKKLVECLPVDLGFKSKDVRRSTAARAGMRNIGVENL